MKKIIYAILSIFMMVACTNDHLEDIPTLPKENANGEKVTLNFSVAVPEAQNVDSRGFGEKATISKMYVVVFDGSGRLSESVEATLLGNNTAVNNHTEVDHTVQKDYRVTLKATDQSRIIHFVAYDEITNEDPLTEKLDPTTIQYASESTIFGEDLNVTGERDVYWQRITVSGIYAEKNADGSNKIVNGNVIGQIPNEMQLVHLVRNFAKITVNTDKVKSHTSFKYTGFVVVNTESHGTVAPYNGTRGFPNFVTSITEGETTTYSCDSYDNLVSIQRFTGTVPSRSSTNEEIPETPETVTENNPDPYTSDAKYVYERTHDDKLPTYIIIKGTWGGKATYYKVDIVKKGSANTNGYTPDQYYHILRNFAYNIVIDAVNGEGYESAEQAAAEAASNNISASVTLQPLANISDGTSRLFVNYTEKILISGKQNSVDLEFMYLPNANSTTVKNAAVYISKGNGILINSEITKTESGTNKNYWTYTIPVTKVDVLSEQTVTVFVPGGLQRTVNYIMIPQAYSLVANCWDGGNEAADRNDKQIPANMNKEVTVSVKIPTGLPSSIFPLTFILGSDQHSIYSDAAKNSLPVRSGANVIPGNQTGNISFAFEKELTKEDYDALVEDAGANATTVEFLCYFKTNKAQSASNIYVYNEYFNLGTTSFSNSEAEVETESITKSLKITRKSGLSSSNVTNNLTITSSSSNVTIDSYTHNGNGEWSIKISYIVGSEASLTFTYDGTMTDRTETITLSEFLNSSTTSIYLE